MLGEPENESVLSDGSQRNVAMFKSNQGYICYFQKNRNKNLNPKITLICRNHIFIGSQGVNKILIS